ncbi:uncharacterized protein TNCV_1210811 [Trichonephila clavipes]|nr:uncharacterized protein TNCV_1210811 [Trichonephila clavipes]
MPWPKRSQDTVSNNISKRSNTAEMSSSKSSANSTIRLSNARWAAVAEWYRYRIVACLVTSSSPVPPKTHRVGQRCTLNLSKAETRPPVGVVFGRGGASSHRCRPRHLTMVQNYVIRRQKPSCS